MMRKRTKVLWTILIILVLLAGGAAWYLYPYEPDSTAVQAKQSDDIVRVADQEKWIDFAPVKRNGKQLSIIIYPGGLVKPESYAPMAKALAGQGHHTVIVRMPLNLAILGKNLADDVLKAFPKEQFVLGGHSFGGSMAARYAAAHPETLKGMFFLAAYADDGANLSDSQLPILSIMASNDKVLNWDKFRDNKQNLPDQTQYFSIEGGNHSQFGSYGEQKGDGAATISADEQRTQVVHALVTWLQGISTSK